MNNFTPTHFIWFSHCWLISFSYFLNSSFVCCCLLLILFTLVSSSSLCFFIFLFVCYSLLPRKIWMSLSGHVPAWARSDHRRRLYDQDRRDRWREDQTADLGHCRPGAVRAWYSDQCMLTIVFPIVSFKNLLDRFRSITQSYYRSAHALILVYDVSNQVLPQI